MRYSHNTPAMVVLRTSIAIYCLLLCSRVAALPSRPSKNLVISNVKTLEITRTNAAIVWATNEPADSALQYGSDTTYGMSYSTNALVTSHRFTINPDSLMPNTTYHYRVISSNGNGIKAISPDETFMTKGIPLIVTITDHANKLIPRTFVMVNNKSMRTNSSGTALFAVGIGRYNISASKKDLKNNAVLSVNQSKVSTSKILLTLQFNKTVPNSPGLIFFILLLLLFLMLLLGLIR